MAGRRVLADTNALAPLLNGDAAALRFFGECAEVLLCPPVDAELRFGALKSDRASSNLARIDLLRAGCTPVSIDTSTAAQFAEAKLKLMRKGRQIPENDLWIAALALQHDLTVATFDRHFNEVEGLVPIHW